MSEPTRMYVRVPMRVRKAMDERGMVALEDFAKLSELEVLAIKNVGVGTMEAIRVLLQQHGMNFAAYSPAKLHPLDVPIRRATP